jgi:hypothetical protein
MKNINSGRNLLGAMVTLSITGCCLWVNSVNSQPLISQKIQSVHINTPITNISGNIVPPRVGLSYPIFQTDCSQITVTLIGGTKKILASTQASGSHITNGCSYTLTFRDANYKVLGANPSFEITASGGRSSDYIIFGRDSISKPFPSQFDVQVDKVYTGPK